MQSTVCLPTSQFSFKGSLQIQTLLCHLVMNSTAFLLCMRKTLYNILFLERGPVQHYNTYFLAQTYKGCSHRHLRKDHLSNQVHFHSLYHTLIDLSAFDALRQALPSLVIFVFVLNERHNHRRTGNFRPGGAVNHLPKKFLQVAQIFTKQSKRNEGHTMQQHRPYWKMKMPGYSFSGSIPAKFEHKLRRHKQTFGKIATTVVLEKDQNLS